VRDRGGDALVVVAAIGLGDLVGSQPQGQIARVGHGFDTGGVDGLELLDELEDAVELIERASGFFGREFESGQIGDPGDVGGGE